MFLNYDILSIGLCTFYSHINFPNVDFTMSNMTSVIKMTGIKEEFIGSISLIQACAYYENLSTKT